MARIRTIKPEMAQDEDLAECTIEAQLLAVRILCHADDEGYFKANAKLVKAACFPLSDYDSLKVHGMLNELSNANFIRLFEGSNGKEYGYVRGFTKHQKVNRPSESKIKPYDTAEPSNGKGLEVFTEHSMSPHQKLSQEQGTGNREQGKEHEGISGDESPNTPQKKSKNYPDWFESLWEAYPKRVGSNDKRKAFQAANSRLKDGKTVEYLADAVERYSRFIHATGKQNTEFVKQAATFFGPGEHIDNPWRIPDATNQQRPAGGQPVSHAERVRAQARKDFERRHGQCRDDGYGDSPVHSDERSVSGQGPAGRVVDLR